MIFGIILLVFMILILVLYICLFKEYSEVMANYNTLLKVIETRDLLLMRVLPEVKNKKIKENMSLLVAQRMEAKKKGNNELIKTDVEINKHLKPIYDEINKTKNPIVKEEFRRIVNLEKKLKIIRREYNSSVEKYNQKILKKPNFYIKKLKMVPLNTYNFKD